MRCTVLPAANALAKNVERVGTVPMDSKISACPLTAPVKVNVGACPAGSVI